MINSNLIPSLKLGLICFVSVFILSIANFFAEPLIKKNNQTVINKSNKELFPEGESFEKTEYVNKTKYNLTPDDYYFIVKNKSNNVIGYIASVTGTGYGGEMNLMIAFDLKFKILNMKLLKNSETPGFGKKWEKQDAMNMFVDTNSPKYPLPQNKNMVKSGYIDGPNGVTGATITFNGIVEAINKSLELLKSK